MTAEETIAQPPDSPGSETDSDAQSARIRIRNAAIELFSAQGYARTTTSAIAKLAGVNESTLFRNFGRKQQLFNEIFYELTPGVEQVTLSELSNGEDLERDLRIFFTKYLELHIQHMPAFRLSLQMPEEMHDDEIFRRSGDKINGMVSQFVSYMDLLKFSGKVIQTDYAALAELMFSLFLVQAQKFIAGRGNGGDHSREAIDAFAREQAAHLCRLIQPNR